MELYFYTIVETKVNSVTKKKRVQIHGNKRQQKSRAFNTTAENVVKIMYM